MWNTGQVQQGEGPRLIPVAEVIYFKAGDKYTAVTTRQGGIPYRQQTMHASFQADVIAISNEMD
jgi:DNA-binding LytR/AlgR family response regulator